MDEEFYEQRLVTDLAFERERLLRALEDLERLRETASYREALGAPTLRWLRDECGKIRQRMDDPFTVVLVGDFKRGKSTLVNAILGMDVAPTAATPETVTVNRVSYAPQLSLMAQLRNGRKLSLLPEEAGREKLEAILEKLPSQPEYLDFGAPAEILKEIRIVDTPGVGDVLNRFDGQVQEYITRADAVIDVVSALSPLSETEQAFLCAAVLPQNVTKFYAAVNMCDALESEEDLSRVTEMIRERIGRILPQATVYPISALDEVCRRKGTEVPNRQLSDLLHASFEEMTAQILSQATDKREVLLCDRMSLALSRLIGEIQTKLTLLSGALSMEGEEQERLIVGCEDRNSALRQKIEAEKTRLRAAVREMRGQTQQWMDEFLTRLKQEIGASSDIGLEQLEKHFHFYYIDTVQEALTLCAESHLKTLAQYVDESVERLWDPQGRKLLSRTVGTATSGMRMSPIDSAIVGFDVVGALAPGLGLLTMLGKAVMGFAKSKTAPKRSSDYIDHILNNFDAIRRQTTSQIAQIYERFTLSAEERLEEGYESRIQETLEAVSQAQSLCLLGREKREQSAAVLLQLQEELERIGGAG